MTAQTATQLAACASQQQRGKLRTFGDRDARHQGPLSSERGLPTSRSPVDTIAARRTSTTIWKAVENPSMTAVPGRRHKKPSSPPMRGVGGGQMAGQAAQIARRRQQFGQSRRSRGRNRAAAQRRFALQERARPGRRLPPAPASRRNRPACRRASACERRGRAGGPAATVEPRRRPPRPSARRCRDGGGWCRWRSRARRAGWRRTAPARPLAGVGRRRVSAGRPAARDSRRGASSRAAEMSTAVTWAPAAASCIGLAAGRGAEIGDALAAHVAEQPHGQGGGGVLHPPGALGKARQLGDVAAARSARSVPVGQRSASSWLGPEIGIAADGEVERRLVQVRRRDGARRILAIGVRSSSPTASAAC